jgi:hypothetical protein
LRRLRAQLDEASNGDRQAWVRSVAPLAQGGRRVVGLYKGVVMMKIVAVAGIGTALCIYLVGARGSSSRSLPPPTPPAASAPVRSEAGAVAVPGVPMERARFAPGERQRMLDQLAAVHRPTPLPLAPSGPAPSAPADEGSLDKEYVRTGVRELIGLVKECYDQGLARRPDLAGRLIVEFTIVGEPGIGGLVTTSTIADEGSTISDPGMRECVQETLYGARFPAPAGGGEVKVHYPFAFSTAPDEPDGGRP